VAKYLKNSAGQLAEESSVGTSAGSDDSGKIPHLNEDGILDATIVNSKATSAGADDAAKLVALDSTGKIDQSMMPVGIGADTATIQASEALVAGDLVNIHDMSGARVRKADASNGRRAHGFVLAAVSSGASATVYFEGANTQVSGLTPGDTLYLSATPGQATPTAPSTSGQIVQEVGAARSATSMDFEPQRPILLA